MKDSTTDIHKEVDRYLEKFGHAKNISLPELWAEMDRVWDACKLDNRKAISEQDIGLFYSHPVWILNGLFAETDPVSLAHREAIASFIQLHGSDNSRSLRVADFGGGSGVLADVMTRGAKIVATVDIIEPWPLGYFMDRHAGNDRIKYRSDFSGDGYDVVVAEDVLEHVDDPMSTAIRCVDAVRQGGLVIFANCFEPVIKCHLPVTFYLRHIFHRIICSKTLNYVGRIPGAPHAQTFRKTGEIDIRKIWRRNRFARLCGPMLNRVVAGGVLLRSLVRKWGTDQ